MNDPVLVHNEKGNFYFVNETASETLGYDRDELLSMSPDQIISSKSQEKAEKQIKTVKEKGSSVFEAYLEKNDGEKIPVEMSTRLIHFRGKEAVLCIARDITQRKETEKREEFLHSLLKHDLRNKIQVIEGYLELMDDFKLPEEADEYRDKAKGSSRESIDLIEKVRKVREAKEDEIKTIEIKNNLKDVVKKERKKPRIEISR